MVEPTQSRPNAAGQRPSVRARALKETLAFLDEYRPELARMVEVDAPSDTLCAIREALPVDWISAELSRGLIEVIVDELGAHDGLNVWRDLVTYRLRHSSVIGPLISLATTVGFAAPWSFAKQVPRGWENTYKDYGSPRVSRDGAQAVELRRRKSLKEGGAGSASRCYHPRHLVLGGRAEAPPAFDYARAPDPAAPHVALQYVQLNAAARQLALFPRGPLTELGQKFYSHGWETFGNDKAELPERNGT